MDIIESKTALWDEAFLVSSAARETINYSVATAEFGEVLVARNHRGIRATLIGKEVAQ